VRVGVGVYVLNWMLRKQCDDVDRIQLTKEEVQWLLASQEGVYAMKWKDTTSKVIIVLTDVSFYPPF
jgi:hypothetical protein